MNTLVTQVLQAAQIPEIVALDKICLGGLWTAQGYQREIESPNSTLLSLNLIDREVGTESKMIGVACLWSILEEAHITLLAIHPDYRQQGFGTLLLLCLFEDAIARNLSWATLEVNENNEKAINLYKKFGFEVAGKRKKYYKLTGDNALILWRKKLRDREFKVALSQWQQDLTARLSNSNYFWQQSRSHRS